MDNIKLRMSLLEETFGVCRLEKNENIPEWCKDGEFYSITKTMDELSIVCNLQNIPEDIKCEKPWKALKVEGPLDFSLIGILASISRLLAERCISIFAISTYDTDYILVKEKDINKAIDALSNEGYKIRL
ncbi:ACT domain-containing protein [uncultured Clostridium sp.]|uniref:ACT domain-containing protein n=1 Tax=uncultured Clostridium sp. TaxID=59620 RepID=UPI0028E1F6E6|nr:ACT domain-containing protein [uncultured Clostridium sp.]